MSEHEPTSERVKEVSAGLAETHRRIADACARAGRLPADVTLIVVTKTHPASDVAALVACGVRDVGENRHPEAGDKADELTGLVDAKELPRWHFLGGLQTNKAGAVARYADVVQSVDRPKLARSLSRGAEAAERELGVLVQVDFDGSDAGRSGVEPDAIGALADLIATLPGLRLDGLMTVAPLGVEPRPVFDSLVAASQRLRREHPAATVVSAGMSDDFEDAVLAGATHLRVGRAILGERPPVR